MISIIIPVYNVEKYLPKCLDSILAQTFTDYEVILIDDGSPDGSGAICDAYAQKDSRLRVIHQKNAGVSTARNNGIEHARGEWITFIDSDDWVEPAYLSNFRLEESNNIDLIIQGLEYYDHRDGHFFNPWSFKDCVLEKQNFRLGFAENRLMEVGFPIGKAYLKRLLMFSNLRFDSRISFHEDHIFVLDYYQLCHRIRLVDATDYKYRCYHTGTSLSSKRHSWVNLNIAAEGMLKALDNLKDKYLEAGSLYERKIFNYAYSPKISAAMEVFRLKDSDYMKQNALNSIIDVKQIGECYRPFSKKEKLVKFVLMYVPYIFQKYFFSLYIYYQNCRK